jgi:hypothetical protein
VRPVPFLTFRSPQRYCLLKPMPTSRQEMFCASVLPDSGGIIASWLICGLAKPRRSALQNERWALQSP